MRSLVSILAFFLLAACAPTQMTPEQQFQAQNNALLFSVLTANNHPYMVPFYPMQGPAMTNCIASGLYMSCTSR